MTQQQYVQRLEQARDLRSQLAGLGKEDEPEIVFQEWSPGRQMVSLWSTETGEEIVIPQYMAEGAINTPREDGQGYRFTARQEEAPRPKRNSVRCFLHADAPERDVLQQLGISKTCPAAHLASNYSKRVHAQHRHKAEWAMYQEHVSEQREDEYRMQQAQQLEATLAIARAAGASQAAGEPEPKRGPGRPRKEE